MLAMMLFLPVALHFARRMSRAYGIALVVMAGSLFLPEGVALVDLPLVPSIEKERLTYLSALVVMLAFHRQDYRAARPGAGPEMVFLLMVLAFLCTAATNRNPMFNYGLRQEPLGLYWILARSLDDLVTIVLPFVVGRTAFRSGGDLRALAYVIVAAGLVYVLLIGLEALLSLPFGVWQFSLQIYGVPQLPSWRWGGIQPVVFMENALSSASFMVVAVIMAAGFAASRAKVAWRGVRRAHLWTALGLLLTRVSSCNAYGVVLGGLLRLVRARTSGLVGLLVAVLVCAYPALRLADVFPDEKLVEIARDLINEERATSFGGRFGEEDFVFAGLGDRLWFGWGMFDRIPGAATFGQNQDGLDSFLVIRVGLTGIAGTELIMLLLLIPVWVAWRRLRLLEGKESQFLVAALMMCIGARMVDFLMNGLFNSLPFFLAGALYGVGKSIGQPDGGWDMAPEPDAGKSRRPASRRSMSRRHGGGNLQGTNRSS